MAKYAKADAKDYAREKLRGIYAANLTPFEEDGTVDEPGLRANLRHWIDTLKLAGLFINGKQAEFFSMSLAERKQQFDIVMDEVGDRSGTVMSCSDENLDTVLELGRHAQEIGADWIIVHAPPLYFHHDVDAVLTEYYRHIAGELDIGICIWHQPDYGYVMEPETCARIAEIENIVGIKYSVDRDRYARLTELAGDRLIVSTSSEDLWLENIVELGWQVYLCSTPPYLMQTAYDQRMNDYTRLAFEGKVEEARAVRDSLGPVRAALKGTRPGDKPQAQQKYWQDLLGQAGGPVRRPLLNLSDAEKAAVKAAFDGCGLQVTAKAAE